MAASKHMAVFVRGKTSEYAFHFYGDPANIAEWSAEGINVVIVDSTIPAWAVDLGLARVWVFAQKAIQFRNPFA